MVLELCQPASLLLTLLFLYGVFHEAFLVPATSIHARLQSSAEMLALAAGCALVSGIIFLTRDRISGKTGATLADTLPVRTFYWAAMTMALLFVVSAYLETQCHPVPLLPGK